MSDRQTATTKKAQKLYQKQLKIDSKVQKAKQKEEKKALTVEDMNRRQKREMQRGKRTPIGGSTKKKRNGYKVKIRNKMARASRRINRR